MNEELQIAITGFINGIADFTETAYNIGAEQMPIIVQELLLWNGVKSFLFFLIGIAFVCGAVACCKIARSAAEKQKRAIDLEAEKARSGYDAKDPKYYVDRSLFASSTVAYDRAIRRQNDFDSIAILAPAYALSGPLTLIGSWVSLASLEWLQILLAPRVWLIEYAASFIK